MLYKPGIQSSVRFPPLHTHSMDSPDDYLSPPPPAYSEQSFDQKVSRATEISLHTAKWETLVDEDGWPQYDPAAFESSSTKPSKGYLADGHPQTSSSNPYASSSEKNRPVDQHLIKQLANSPPNNLPSIGPLRIEKKAQPKSQEPANHYLPSTSQYVPQYEPQPRPSVVDVHPPYSQDGLATPAAPTVNISSGDDDEGHAYDDYGIPTATHSDPPPTFHEVPKFEEQPQVPPQSPGLPMNPVNDLPDGRHSLVDSYYQQQQSPQIPPIQSMLMQNQWHPPHEDVNQAPSHLSTNSNPSANGSHASNRHSIVDSYYQSSQLPISPRQSLPPPSRPQVQLPERPLSSYGSSPVQQQDYQQQAYQQQAHQQQAHQQQAYQQQTYQQQTYQQQTYSSPSHQQMYDSGYVQQPSVPRLNFNPNVAYRASMQPTVVPAFVPQKPAVPLEYDPHSFYK